MVRHKHTTPANTNDDQYRRHQGGARDARPKGIDQSTTYLQQRTNQVRFSSNDASRHSMANPFHSRFTAATPPPPANSPRAHSTSSPSRATLSILKGEKNQKPATHFSWQKSELTTPLNAMPTGTSQRWTHAADTVAVQLPTNSNTFDRSVLNQMQK